MEPLGSMENKITKNKNGENVPHLEITSTELYSKKSVKELPNDKTEADAERATTKKRYISPEERQQLIDKLRLG